ncbi:MAG TPA: hypothetical protein VLD16_13520 [Gaiellaceae bacterium]|nr:hypothetical protein [Gaiellaceae bacterium]
MARKHAFVLAIALGVAATVGAIAAVNTARLGQPQAKASTVAAQNVALRKRTTLLDRQEAALRRALAKRPPKLPRVPKFAPVPTAAPHAVQVSGAAPTGAPSVQYVRPAPIVIVKHRAHGDDGHEQEHEGGGGGDD